VSGRDGTPYGITANSFTSVSCSPPLILICIGHNASALPHFRASSLFGINILAESQRDLSVRFAERQGDRFSGIGWKRSEAGIPVLDDVLATLECSVAQTIEAGDHTIFLGEVFRAEYRDGDPLLYYSSAYRHISDPG
jgi:flavin reductase (DIM6/NTAB) family NADH-FMN oxidoreductase RutF